MSNTSISRRIALTGGRLPLDEGMGNSRMVGPTYINLAAQMAAGATQSVDLTSAAAFNGSKAIRSVWSNTSSTPEIILHVEAVQWWISSQVFATASAALKAQVVESASIRFNVGGTVSEFDLLQCTHDSFGSFDNQAAPAARYLGSGPLVLPNVIRLDATNDEMSLEVTTGAFAAPVNSTVAIYGWAYNRNAYDEAFSDSGCAAGTVSPERFSQLTQRFYSINGVPLMG